MKRVGMLYASLLVAGSLQASSSPKRGMVLITIGAIGMASLWYWVWMVSVPIATVLVVLAFVNPLNSGRVAGPPRIKR